MKNQALKTTESKENEIHYAGVPGSDIATLCGLVDQAGGEATDLPVTCQSCRDLVDYVKMHEFK